MSVTRRDGRFKRHAEQLQPVADQPEAEFPRHPLLQLLDLLVAELDHRSGLDVDQVVVVLARGCLVALRAGAEIVAGENSFALEQP